MLLEEHLAVTQQMALLLKSFISTVPEINAVY